MGQLVLLVVAAAWAAVLIPPLLRSRLENRPNSSVTDFRRQLNKLESAVPSRAGGAMRGVARPLAQSPLQRPAAGGRPATPTVQPHRRSASGHSPAQRSHGERTHRGRDEDDRSYAARDMPRHRSHGDATGGHPRSYRQTSVARHGVTPAEELRRRRSNVMFMLVIATASSFFLAATTKAQIFYYVFALAFLSLFGFAFLLSQARQRESQSWPNDWMQR